jgi:hypothetical protein
MIFVKVFPNIFGSPFSKISVQPRDALADARANKLSPSLPKSRRRDAPVPRAGAQDPLRVAAGAVQTASATNVFLDARAPRPDELSRALEATDFYQSTFAIHFARAQGRERERVGDGNVGKN